VRVVELVHIEIGDVDLDACKIFINRGKGAKDRCILFRGSWEHCMTKIEAFCAKWVCRCMHRESKG
jgi:site-specific recombinase XerD